MPTGARGVLAGRGGTLDAGFGGRGGWKLRGRRGCDYLGRELMARMRCPEPDAGDDDRHHDTRQHQTDRITHGYASLNTHDKIGAMSFMENSY